MEEALLWIHILAGINGLKLKAFVSDKHADFHLTKHKLMNWSNVDYCDVFIRTLILTAPIHCRGSIAEQVIQC